MVFVLFSTAMFGVYTTGAQEVPIVTSVAYSITAALLPTLVIRYERGDVQGFIELWHGSMVKVATIMMPVFFYCFLEAEMLVRLIYSDPFADATIPFRVYLCLLPLRLCMYGGVVRALGQTRPVMLSALAGLIVNAALNYPLFLLFGLAGPGIATVLAQLTAIIALLAAVRKTLTLRWREVFPYASVLRVIAVAGVAAAPLWLVLQLVDSKLNAILLGAALYTPTYLVFAWLARVIGPSDLRYLKNLVTFRRAR